MGSVGAVEPSIFGGNEWMYQTISPICHHIRIERNFPGNLFHFLDWWARVFAADDLLVALFLEIIYCFYFLGWAAAGVLKLYSSSEVMEILSWNYAKEKKYYILLNWRRNGEPLGHKWELCILRLLLMNLNYVYACRERVVWMWNNATRIGTHSCSSRVYGQSTLSKRHHQSKNLATVSRSRRRATFCLAVGGREISLWSVYDHRLSQPPSEFYTQFLGEKYKVEIIIALEKLRQDMHFLTAKYPL